MTEALDWSVGRSVTVSMRDPLQGPTNSKKQKAANALLQGLKTIAPACTGPMSLYLKNIMHNKRSLMGILGASNWAQSKDLAELIRLHKVKVCKR